MRRARPTADRSHSRREISGRRPQARLFATARHPVPRLAAMLFEQLDVGDGHAAVDRLAHVVDGEQADAKPLILNETREALQPVFGVFCPSEWDKIGTTRTPSRRPLESIARLALRYAKQREMIGQPAQGFQTLKVGPPAWKRRRCRTKSSRDSRRAHLRGRLQPRRLGGVSQRRSAVRARAKSVCADYLRSPRRSANVMRFAAAPGHVATAHPLTSALARLAAPRSIRIVKNSPQTIEGTPRRFVLFLGLRHP